MAVTFSLSLNPKLTASTQSPISNLDSFVRGQMDRVGKVPAVEIVGSLIPGESEIRE